MATKQPQQKFESLEFTFEPNEWFVDPKRRAEAIKALEAAENRAEAAQKLGISTGVLALIPPVEEDGLIPFRSQKELVQKVVKLRDKDAVSWGRIGARAGGMTEGRVQSLYEEGSGKEYTVAEIGKGGRPLGTTSGTKVEKKATKKTTKKASSKKASSKKTAAKADRPFPNPDPEGGDDEAVTEAILGNEVTVDRPGGATATYEVAEVVKFGNSKAGARGVQITDTDGKKRTFGLAKIVSIA